MRQTAILLFFIVFMTSRSYGQSKIEIIDTPDSLTTVPQLLSKFKGSPVFVDLWAPWCEPCKEEFKYSDELYKQLRKRGIQLLFVSLQTRVTDSAWRTDIATYHLQGNHVKCNQQLQNAFSTLIWGAPGGFSIPHYLLFDSTGKVMVKDALAPSSQLKLLKQIDKVLSQ